MKWFYNMKISAKLLTGFILVAVLTGAMGIFGAININSLNEADKVLYDHMTVPISQMGAISTAFQRFRNNVRDMIIAQNSVDIENNIKKIEERRDEVNLLQKEFEATIISNEMREAFKAFTDSRSRLAEQLKFVIEFARANRDEEALRLIAENGAFGKVSREEQDAIENIVKLKIEDAKQKAEENTSKANSTITVMVIIIIVVMVLSIILGFFISAIISKPLKKAVLMMQEMSMGHLGMRLKMDTTDEVGQMAAAMDNFANDLQNVVVGTMKMIANGDVSANVSPRDDKDEIGPAMKQTIETIRSFVSEMQNMSAQHDLGDIDVVVDETKFEGTYKVMAKGVNDMVNGHISVKKKAMACVAEFVKGNFEAELEKFPGKKAFINNNMEALRKNLKDVNYEIAQLVDAAIEGRLDTRANASVFEGDWKKLTLGLNSLLEAVIKPVQEAAVVLNEMSNGNLQKRVVGDYKGDHAEIKNALNNTLEALSSYVEEISEVLTQMANSNMVLQIDIDYKGDFAPIKESLNLIIDSFNQVLMDFNVSADQVAAGSRQVSDGSQALSQGATEQASSIEQLTASINEIAEQTKQNAINANEANELAIQAKTNAVSGNTQMKDMLKAMEEINISSANISKIIKVIDEIAFQTNILALNAAVEAARAGQHGKGFAVVAEEVRNLAARSASAAKETTGMIEGSIKKVEIGTKIANETAVALDKIVNDVAKAANLVGTIASASNEQATGIAQVNLGVEQVSQVIQTNSATAEQSAAASEELSSQADILKDMIGRFNLKNSGDKTDKALSYGSKNFKNSYQEAAATKFNGSKPTKNQSRNKPQIALSDREFGKY